MTASSFRQGRTCDNARAMNTPTDLRSPYQPPNADLTGPPQVLPPLQAHERSGAPKVFGVLSIIFASIVLLSSSDGHARDAGDAARPPAWASWSPDPEKAAEVTTMMQPMAKVYQGIGLQSAILFVMSALLLAIGIGQLRYRAWAQRWSVYWGVAGLACVGLMVAISLLIISPAYAEFFESMSHIKPQGGGQASVPSMGPMAGMFGGTFAVDERDLLRAVPRADAAVLHARSRARVDDPLARSSALR